jgi:putative peptidoglycan lipid II flippase
MFPLKIAGLALATSLSGIITFFILFAILRKRLGDFKVREIIVSFLRILAASLCMGIVSFSVSKSIFLEANLPEKILNLCAAIITGLITYTASCFIFRVIEMQQLWQWVLKRVTVPK